MMKLYLLIYLTIVISGIGGNYKGSDPVELDRNISVNYKLFKSSETAINFLDRVSTSQSFTEDTWQTTHYEKVKLIYGEIDEINKILKEKYKLEN